MLQILPISRNFWGWLLRFLRQTDWVILFLLLGITNNFLWIKIGTVSALVLYSFFRKKGTLRVPAIPFFFYTTLPLVGLIGAWMAGSFQFEAYKNVLVYGGLQWLVSAAGFWLLYTQLEKRKNKAVDNSLYVFAILNLLASLYWLVHTMWESGSWWPYGILYSEKYGISTGDYIRGIFWGSSVVNAACSALLMLYFSQQKKFVWAAVAMVSLWLCGSNLLFLLTLALLGFQILTQSKNRLQPFLFTLLTAAGYTVINFQNMPYLIRMSQGTAVVETAPPGAGEETRAIFKSTSLVQKEDLYSFLKDIPTPQEQRHAAAILDASDLAAAGILPPDTHIIRRTVAQIYHQPYSKLPAAHARMPLKAFALLQTLHYMAYHPQQWPFGAGMGNASSKLAIKVTGLGLHGQWPSGKAYVGAPFYAAHLQDLLYLFSQDVSQHSIAHAPNNTYLQILSEYGLAGVILFLFLYVLYFVRHVLKSQTRHWAVLLLTALLLATDYWLESISVLVVFELLMLLSFQAPEKILPD